MVSVFRHTFVVMASLCALGLVPGPARGQSAAVPPENDPVLQALIEEALARNPDLHAAQSAISAAQTATERARALPDPMVSMTYTNDGWAPSLGSMPMTTLGFMVSQSLPYSGKRDLRASLAASQARQAEPALARARLALEGAVRRAYYGLLLARELQALTAEQRELLQQIEVVARARYAVGQGAQPDVLRVQTEVTRIEQRVIEQAAEAEVRLAEINRLLARPLDTPVETTARLTLLPLGAPADEMLDQARAVSPELRSAALAIETSTAAAAVARRDLKPDFSVQGGYMNRGGLDAMWLAGVGISWPFNKKARESAVAEAEIRAKGGSHVVESMGLQLAYKTRERFTRAKSLEKLVTLYDDGIIPQDQMTVEATLTSYQTGRVPFVSVLEAMTALYADRWARAGLVADHARLRASLREASLDGGPDVSQTSAPVAGGLSSGQTAGGMSGGMGGK
ncbi:MAG: TolC family protein [Vicinamibacterales bacterium]|jgi:outer membrane protein TolC|nr:TolC family protein [Vicinamibacterales bacterium]